MFSPQATSSRPEALAGSPALPVAGLGPRDRLPGDAALPDATVRPALGPQASVVGREGVWGRGCGAGLPLPRAGFGALPTAPPRAAPAGAGLQEGEDDNDFAATAGLAPPSAGLAEEEEGRAAAVAVAAAALPTDAALVFTPPAVRVLVPAAGPADWNPAEAVAGLRAEAGSRVPAAKDEDEDEDGAAGFPLLRALVGLARLLADRAALSRDETAELASVGTPAWPQPVLADDEVWGLADDEVWGLADDEVWGLADDEVWGLADDESWGLADDEVWGLADDEAWGLADDEAWGLADDEVWGLADAPVCFRSLLELGHDRDEDKELSAAPFARAEAAACLAAVADSAVPSAAAAPPVCLVCLRVPAGGSAPGEVDLASESLALGELFVDRSPGGVDDLTPDSFVLVDLCLDSVQDDAGEELDWEDRAVCEVLDSRDLLLPAELGLAAAAAAREDVARVVFVLAPPFSVASGLESDCEGGSADALFKLGCVGVGVGVGPGFVARLCPVAADEELPAPSPCPCNELLFTADSLLAPARDEDDTGLLL